MSIVKTEYYDEFLRYYEMAKTQQQECNLGTIPHSLSSIDDDLMKSIHLYDVVNRKYAGFTQIIHDIWHNTQDSHPYKHKMHDVRLEISKNYSGIHNVWTMQEWTFLFIVHRITGSGINYAKNPSGYHNTILTDFFKCKNISEMCQVIAKRAEIGQSFYTSVGYQFPAFPKPEFGFKTGGNMFLIKHAPNLAISIASFLTTSSKKKTLREVGDFMFNWNVKNGFRVYKFQYAAIIADIADFYPNLVDCSSLFYYGSNAIECIKYMAKKTSKLKNEEFLDEVVLMACSDTGGNPYDVEDVMCDTIRWIENYARPGHDYNHVDRDLIFSSCKIKNHPFGRQKAMLDLNLIKSFNDLKNHPRDNYIINQSNISVEQYKEMVCGLV